MAKKTDLRVIKTQQAIKDVFIKLMFEEGFNSITVKEIVTQAQINRGTFYLHYKDKFDLLDSIEKDLLRSLLSVTQTMPYDKLHADHIHWQDFYDCFNQFTRYVADHGELFALLQSEKGDPSFQHKFYDVCEIVWQKHELTDNLSIPQNYALTALISMTGGMMLEWVNSGFKESPEEFMQILLKLVSGIPNSILKK